MTKELISMRRMIVLPLIVVSLSAECSFSQDVEIVRDTWGVAHVYAEQEEPLFFGAGYAMAEDRMFQMMLMRRKAQGRLSEILGPGRNDSHLNSDILSRTLNVAGHARNELNVLDPVDRTNLQAFAAGINRYLKDHQGGLLPEFEKYGGDPEPWTPDHSLAIWIRLSADFDKAWKSEVKARREFEENPDAYRIDERRKNQAPAIDDAAAIVTEQEFSRSWPEAYEELMKHAQMKQKAAFLHPLPPPQTVKASHNWVVSGQRSATGKPILGGKPQLTVQNPNTTYEMHLSGGRYNVRGMTWPGGPGMLVGFNQRISWAATAMNTDAGDLFEERVNPRNDDEYRFRDQWLEFRLRHEPIAIKGREAVELRIRETIHGPVVNDLIQGATPNEVYTLRSTFAPATTSTVNGLLKMMRAGDWKSFRTAMRDYVAPGAHIVYGDIDGNIGYQSLARIPARDFRITLPRKGWTGTDEWTWLPFEFMPSMFNPESHAISTANGLNVGAWHPFATSNGFGGGPRSMRLKELFAGDRVFSVEDMITDIHRDTVTPPLRDFVTLLTAVIAEDGAPDKDIAAAVQTLNTWNGQTRTDAPGFPLAAAVLTTIQSTLDESWHMDRSLQYGGGWSGLSKMFRDLTAEHRRTGKPPESPEIRKWLLDTLTTALQSDAVQNPGWEPAGMIQQLPWQNNNMFGSLAPEYDLQSPPLLSASSHTIWSQQGETYVQIVDHSDIDRSLAFMPPGISEDPRSPHHRDQMTYWQNGTLRAAPLTRRAVERIKKSVTHLRYHEP